MEKVEWDEIIKNCAEDYKALKEVEGVNIKTPPRDFIRAWMQVRYHIFKLSGYFYRRFNSYIIQENRNRLNDTNISESVFNKVKNTRKNDLDKMADDLLKIPYEKIKKLILKKGDEIDNYYNDWEWIFYPDMEIFGVIPKSKALFVKERGRDSQTRKYVIDTLCWSGGIDFVYKDSKPFIRFSFYDEVDGDIEIGDEGGTMSLDELMKKFPNEFIKMMDYIRPHLSCLNESVFNRIRKTTSADIKKMADYLLRYKIGDCYPSENKVEGIIVGTPDEMGEKCYLIMTPTCVDRLGKPTTTKGFRNYKNLDLVVKKYCKKHGNGWQMLTYDWAKKIGFMENSYNLSWNYQNKIFRKFRNPIEKTLEKLGYDQEEIYGSMMIMQKSPNWSGEGNFNMGGWDLDSYNSGSMLRLFKKVGCSVSESLFNKIKKTTSVNFEKNAEQIIEDFEDIDIFFKKIANYFNSNTESLSKLGKQNGFRISFRDESKTATYKTKSEGEKTWEKKRIVIDIDYIKSKIKKKTQEVVDEYIGNLQIVIHNNIHHRDTVHFELNVRKPYSFKSLSSLSNDSWIGLNFVGELDNNPKFERFIIPMSWSWTHNDWRPTLRTCQLFEDVIKMIAEHFKEINIEVNQYANNKVYLGFQNSLNRIKETYYNQKSV